MRRGNIYTPKLEISDASAELISVAGSHLNDFLYQRGHNSREHEVIFSPRESSDLKMCIDRVLSDSDLFFSLYFVEKLVGDRSVSEESLKEIYLTQRKRFGYDRSLSSARWHSFLTRLGMREGSPSTYLQGASIMDFDHFLRMERRLFNLLGLPEAVSEFAIDLVSKNRDSVEPLRRVGFERRQGLSSFSFVECIKSSLKSIRENNSIPPDKLTALMVVITNSTSLFSSRDWSVAGTISTMAGGITMAIYGE